MAVLTVLILIFSETVPLFFYISTICILSIVIIDFYELRPHFVVHVRLLSVCAYHEIFKRFVFFFELVFTVVR